MSTDPLARYARQIKRPLSDAERSAIAAAPPTGDARKAKRQLRKAANKARRQELGLKPKARKA